MCARRETELPACTHKLRHHRSVHMQQACLPSHTHTLMCPELHAHTQVVLQPAPLPLSSGPQTSMTDSEAKVITCFTCSDSHHCGSLPCLADRNSCLQMAGIIGERPWGQDWVGEAETGPGGTPESLLTLLVCCLDASHVSLSLAVEDRAGWQRSMRA